MPKERFFHISYHFQRDNGNYGFGDCYANVTDGKITRHTLEAWKLFIKEDINCNNLVILFYKELEE